MNHPHHPHLTQTQPFVVATHVSVPVTVSAPPPPAVSSSSIYRPLKSDIARLSKLLLETPGPIDLSPFDALFLDAEGLRELAFQMQNRAAAAVNAASIAASATATAAATRQQQQQQQPRAVVSVAAAAPLRPSKPAAMVTEGALAEAKRLQVELEYANGKLRTQLHKSEVELRQARKWKEETEKLQEKYRALQGEMAQMQQELLEVEQFQLRQRQQPRGAATSETPTKPPLAAPSAASQTTLLTGRQQQELAKLKAELSRSNATNKQLQSQLNRARSVHATATRSERAKHEKALRAYMRASVRALSSSCQPKSPPPALLTSRVPNGQPASQPAAVKAPPATKAPVKDSDPESMDVSMPEESANAATSVEPPIEVPAVASAAKARTKSCIVSLKQPPSGNSVDLSHGPPTAALAANGSVPNVHAHSSIPAAAAVAPAISSAPT